MNLFRNTLFTSLLIACLGPSFAWAAKPLPDDVSAALKNAKSFDLYSIEPHARKDAKETLQKYPVLGKTTVADAATRKALIDALEKGIAGNEGEVAGCFNPRHAIRVVHGGKTYDLIICFECLQISIFVNDGRGKAVLTTEEPKAAFDEVLNAANVPLAE
jgi:hypothetical protein